MTKKKILILVISILIVIAGIGTAIILYRQEVARVEREIRTAYAQVNSAFHLNILLFDITNDEHLSVIGVYKPLPEVDPEINRHGIHDNIYLLLLMYEFRTGNVLPYETVVEYFSQEFEPDGSLRLHNNGKHPEINAYVEWIWEDGQIRWFTAYQNFDSRVNSLYGLYSHRNKDNGFVQLPLHELSPQMLRELARVVSDPELTVSDLNLTSLQQQGY